LQLDEILDWFFQMIKVHIKAQWFHNDTLKYLKIFYCAYVGKLDQFKNIFENICFTNVP
jgi:hypothetical protein